jgi:hypothetical protein
MRGALRRFFGRLGTAAAGTALLSICGGVLFGVWWVVDRAVVDMDTPTPARSTPATPDGVSVERVQVGDRTVWCAINYNGGISCDFTREAS